MSIIRLIAEESVLSLLIDHFYESDGKRNKRKVAYFGILKENKTKK